MIKQIFIFIIVFFGIILFSEVFIRTAHISNFSSSEFYDDIGRGCRKNFNYLYFNEGFGIGKYNEYRYIGEAIPPEKQKNSFRVALMGDSFVESFQIFDRDYFGNIAENILGKEYPDIRFEFLNFGRSGFDIADVYAYQKLFVDKFNPDLILYIIENDDLTPQYRDPLLPKTMVENDSLVVFSNYDPSEVNSFEKKKFLPQNFSFFQMINICIKKIKSTPVSAVLFDKFYTLFQSKDNNSKISDKLPDQINSVTLEIIKNLDPNKVIFVDRDLTGLSQTFKTLLRDKGFELIDLNKGLDSLKQAGIDPNKWKVTGIKGHWNHNAHKAIGLYIAENIKNAIVAF